MSRIFEALQKSNTAAEVVIRTESDDNASELIHQAASGAIRLNECATFNVVTTPQARLVAISDEHGLAAEKIRVLATKLRHIAARKPLKRVLVTSSMKGEGKSVIAANLAITLAKSAKASVLLIDGDLRQPTLASKLGCNPTADLAQWWQEDVPVQDVLYHVNELPLWFLPAGQFAMQPLQVLQSPRLSGLVNQLSDVFDWIIIDSPPMVPLADSSVWASLADGVMIVVREKFTQVEMLNQSVELIETKKLLGIVMNDTSVSESKYYPNYYQYSGKPQSQGSDQE